MSKIQDSKQYDLEDRTLEFGKRVIRLSKALSKNTVNFKLTELVKIFAAILEKSKKKRDSA